MLYHTIIQNSEVDFVNYLDTTSITDLTLNSIMIAIVISQSKLMHSVYLAQLGYLY